MGSGWLSLWTGWGWPPLGSGLGLGLKLLPVLQPLRDDEEPKKPSEPSLSEPLRPGTVSWATLPLGLGLPPRGGEVGASQGVVRAPWGTPQERRVCCRSGLTHVTGDPTPCGPWV